MTKWGKVEHAGITLLDKFTSNGENDLPWALKMEIKNQIFGENRLAIEVFPKSKNLVDVLDVYHLWVFPKEFELPFGIHPTRDVQAQWIKRGWPKDVTRLALNMEEITKLQKEAKLSGISD